MRIEKISRLAGLAVALALSACATTSPPAREQTHVGVVEVVGKGPAGKAFAELLHDAVVRQAAFYGDGGRAITLRIELEKVHYRNPLQALLIGDDNQAKGRVIVVDPKAGGEPASFTVVVDAERGGLNGGSIALAVVGALDPTGLIDLGNSAAYATSASLHHSSTATQMSVNFATETLRQTYGDARAKAVAQDRGEPQAAAEMTDSRGRENQSALASPVEPGWIGLMLTPVSRPFDEPFRSKVSLGSLSPCLVLELSPALPAGRPCEVLF